jgi:hypothetical protein
VEKEAERKRIMGKISKGVICDVEGCEEKAERSVSYTLASLSSLKFKSSSRKVYLCKSHYKQFKKETKEARELERLRW